MKVGDIVVVKGEYNGWYKGSVYPKPEKGFFHSSLITFFYKDGKKNIYDIAKKVQPAAKKKEKIDIERDKIVELQPKNRSWWDEELKNPMIKDLLDVMRDWGKCFPDKFGQVREIVTNEKITL